MIPYAGASTAPSVLTNLAMPSWLIIETHIVSTKAMLAAIQTTGAKIYATWHEVREIVSRRREIRDHVDTHNCDEESQRGDNRQRRTVDTVNDLGRIGRMLAEDDDRAGGDKECNQGKESDTDRQAEEIAKPHLAGGADVPGEIAKVEDHGGEVRDHDADDGHEGSQRTAFDQTLKISNDPKTGPARAPTPDPG